MVVVVAGENPVFETSTKSMRSAGIGHNPAYTLSVSYTLPNQDN